MFMDLSEAFDTKLGRYGFQQDALSFMKSNLRGQCQRILINSNFSA